MLLPDVRQLLAGFALTTLMAVGLAGCQVRPLYGSLNTDPSSSVPVQSKLAAISIDPISEKHSDATAARELYNELTFNFERGAQSPDKHYRLKLLMDVSQAEIGVEKLADVPAAYTMTMNTTFVLSDIATETTMMTGRSFATVSYDFSNQRFANIRAERDAQQRVAKSVANDIHARLAGYFTSNR